jgi:hypothetical protein
MLNFQNFVSEIIVFNLAAGYHGSNFVVNDLVVRTVNLSPNCFGKNHFLFLQIVGIIKTRWNFAESRLLLSYAYFWYSTRLTFITGPSTDMLMKWP